MQHEACDCAHHRNERRTWLAALGPVGACALCPACLTTYAKVLALVGIGAGFALKEWQHTLLLGAAVIAVIALAAIDARKTRRYLRLGLATSGCGLLVASELAGDVHWLAWCGCAVILFSGFAEKLWSRPVHVTSRQRLTTYKPVGHASRLQPVRRSG